MSIFKYLKEDLESQQVFAGRSNIWYDKNKGSYEVYFKQKGTTYSFIAESEGTEYDDGTWKIQLRKKWAGNTEMIEDTKELQEAFTEAMMQWVELKNPTTFWWLESQKFPAYNNIAKALSKKLKEYNFIDETAVQEETYDVVERSPEQPYKRFIFTREEIKEDINTTEEWFNKKMDEFSKTTGIYEPVEEIKTNPEHTTPFLSLVN